MLFSIRKLTRQLLGLIPSKLPVGVSEFDVWAQSIIDTYDLPTSDLDSIRFTLSSIIMHLGAQVAYKPKFFFYLTIKAGAAKQVAGAVFYEIKMKQKAADEAAKKAASESAE